LTLHLRVVAGHVGNALQGLDQIGHSKQIAVVDLVLGLVIVRASKVDHAQLDVLWRTVVTFVHKQQRAGIHAIRMEADMQIAQSLHLIQQALYNIDAHFAIVGRKEPCKALYKLLGRDLAALILVKVLIGVGGLVECLRRRRRRRRRCCCAWLPVLAYATYQ
jgi:hypothetical protein